MFSHYHLCRWSRICCTIHYEHGKEISSKKERERGFFRCCPSTTIYFPKLITSNPFKFRKEKKKKKQQSNLYFLLSKDLIKSVTSFLMRDAKPGPVLQMNSSSSSGAYTYHVCIRSGMFALLNRKLNEVYHLTRKNLFYRTAVWLIFFFML